MAHLRFGEFSRSTVRSFLKSGGMKIEKEDVDIDEAVYFLDLVFRLAEIGIKNKMSPEDVVNYFVKLTEQLSKQMEKISPKLK